MKDDFENELNQHMNKEGKLPDNVRHSLDNSYNIIQQQTKRKKSNIVWKVVTSAACALFATGILLTNEQVMASITNLFNFDDKGIDRAVTEGFSRENNSVAKNENVEIILEQQFSDSNKIGLSFQLDFKDPTLLEDIVELSMDYRIKNGNGEYIMEFIPDTKPLKGKPLKYSAGVDHRYTITDKNKGISQFEAVITSNAGQLPNLKDAVLEIETINLFREDSNLQEINGEWNLPITNKNDYKTIEYVMDDKASLIQVIDAKANPTSTSLTFTVDGVYIDENKFMDMKIFDENEKEYASDNGYSMDIDKKHNKTSISANFQLTSYDDAKKLKLVIEGIGEVELLRK